MLKINSMLFNLANKILNFVQNFEKTKNKIPEITTLIIFPILYFLFSYFHEPWFDEAQAWQIAKCATYHDILFYLPHFEGHPPLWHLLLSVFAKNHFPYEITIKSVSFFFSYISVFLIVFKSPFYRIIKVLLPFTYFLFYQYAIISRPYCMVMLGFSLLAIFYKDRFKKPLKYGLVLVFLSLCHVFCFVISSFLTLVWFIESIKNKSLKFKNIVVFSMLLVLYVLLVITIFPSAEAYAVNIQLKNSFLKRLIYTVLIIPANCFVSNVYSDAYLSEYETCDIIINSFVGLLVWYFVYFYTKEKKELFYIFAIPYSVFALVATKYISIQNLGIVYCFFLFISWIVLISKEQIQKTQKYKIIESCFILFVVFALFSNLYWSAKSSILDIFITYSTGKKEAEFIKKHNLDKYKIMAEWNHSDNGINTNVIGNWVTVAPYFEKNIFYNFNDETPEKNYVIIKNTTEDDVNKTYARWRRYGLPDVIVGSPLMEKVFQQDDIYKNYITVYTNNTQYIQKSTLMYEEVITISVKKELAEKLNLKEVEPELKNYRLDSFHILTWLFCKIFEFKDKLLEKVK